MTSLPDLAKNYNGFLRPTLYIKVDNKDVSQDTIKYLELEITSTSSYESSLCSFKAYGADSRYDYTKGEVAISETLTKTFELGKRIDVFLGYSDKAHCKQVFSGFITSINLEYTGESYVRYLVEAMDAKFLLMDNLRSETKTDVKKYSDAVNAVLKGYSAYLGNITITETSELGSPIEQYNQSDYDFIVNIAKKLNYMFYLYNRDVFFVPYANDKTPQLKIAPGKYLTRFTREIVLNNQIQSVIVRSNDETSPEQQIEATASSVSVEVGSGEKSGGDVSNIINDKNQRTVIDPSVKSVDEAQARAQAELDKASLKFVTGEFEIIGTPDVEPGKFVSFTDMNSLVNGNYFITEVKHLFNNSGYTTICKFTNNKI